MKKVIGLSAGRKHKVSETVIKAVLNGMNEEAIKHEVISLSGKVIRPCEACNGCVTTNCCILKDDFQPIMDRLMDADAIVFGAPTYWDRMNGKGQAFWERACFSGRHNSLFPLKNKKGFVVAVDGIGDGRYMVRDTKLYFEDARVKYSGDIAVQGEYACFTCNYGNQCEVGGFIDLFPLNPVITKEITPSPENQHPEKNDHRLKRNILPEAMEKGRQFAKEIISATRD